MPYDYIPGGFPMLLDTESALCQNFERDRFCTSVRGVRAPLGKESASCTNAEVSRVWKMYIHQKYVYITI